MKEYLKSKMDESQYSKLEKINNPKVFEFLKEVVDLCSPASIFINTGSAEDINYIRNESKSRGEEEELAIPTHSIHFDNYGDQARDKKNTKILIPEGEELKGVNTTEREAGLKEVLGFLKDSMKGREMIIGFNSLGPAGSVFSVPCIQVTDSFYVAHSESILYRPGYEDFVSNQDMSYFLKLVHTAGELDERNTSKNLDKRRVYIDLKGDIVYSTNTQYAGNTVGLKKLSMRLAINHASNEGWLCEHMLLMGIKGEGGRVTYMTGAFPSLCGKTSTAMMEDEYIVGDDIAYIRNIDGKARGVNVEKGIFGIIQGVNSKDDPLIWNAINSKSELILSNILMTEDKDIHWIGKDGELPKKGVNHSGEWTPGKKDQTGKEITVSHPNARFTLGLELLNNLDPNWNDKNGVEVSAFVYGGRDSDTLCPVEEAFDWAHGIITKGVSLESETTAATLGKEGVRVLNPMSNLDFVSVKLGKYIQMNLDFGANLKTQPKIFGVNYFLRDKDGGFLNGREDKRVWYKWIEKRAHGEVKAIPVPTGSIPYYEDLRDLFKSVLNKDFTKDDYETLFKVRIQENLKKVERVSSYYKQLSGLPEVLMKSLDEQKERLLKTKEKFGSDYISPFKFIEG